MTATLNRPRIEDQKQSPATAAAADRASRRMWTVERSVDGASAEQRVELFPIDLPDPWQVLPAAPARANEAREESASAMKRAYEDGYARAVEDQLDSLVLLAERFLGASSGKPDDRRTIYAFVDQLQRHLGERTGDRHFVEGGLGI